MAETTIQWTDRVWNPTRGCSRVSPGCGGAVGVGGCYAEKFAGRFCGPGLPYEGLVELGRNGPRWTGRVSFHADKLSEPFSWRKSQRVFVNSMSDLFHKDLSNERIAAVFGAMALNQKHTFQILTKRADRMREWFRWIGSYSDGRHVLAAIHYAQREAPLERRLARLDGLDWNAWPLPNVHLGVSVESNDYRHRVDDLLATPAAVRWVSAEPLLQDLELVDHLHSSDGRGSLDWVVVGGESGPGARAFHLNWARNIRHDCEEAGVPLFVKQLGGRPIDWVDDNEDVLALDDENSQLVKLADRKGGDMSEWPDEYLKVRMMPGERWR